MKKSFLLLGIITLSTIAPIHSMEQRRPEVYTIIDALVVGKQGKIDWPGVFAVLDSMQGVINVNEYSVPAGYTLLEEAVLNENLLATKTLLEKYNANPNIGSLNPLTIACRFNDIPMIKLLLLHNANPYATDYNNHDSFYYVANKPEILKLFRLYTR